MNILGVRIDEFDKKAALAQVRHFFVDKQQHMIVTPNPEMLVQAHTDIYFRSILNGADLSLCDGKGIEFAGKGRLHRITGVDFVRDIATLASKEKRSVFLLGSGSEEVVSLARSAFMAESEDLTIAGIHPGIDFTVEEDGRLRYNEEAHDEMMQQIIMSAPDIVFVAFGHGKQEKWMYEMLPHLPSVSVVMGVGGAFDVISGKIRRAPWFVQRLGLEWVWRLALEPSRFVRILKATVVFPYLIVKDKIVQSYI